MGAGNWLWGRLAQRNECNVHKDVPLTIAVTGTHFATRVPAYQYPAGTRVPVYQMKHVLSFKSRPRLTKSAQ